MLEILKLSRLSDLRDATLLECARRGHCSRSLEFLAITNGQEAGLLSYEDWSDCASAFIYLIFVLPSFRRQGIGASLLMKAESYAFQLGCKSIRLMPYSLDPAQDQGQLIAWYKKKGFSPIIDNCARMEKHLKMPDSA